MSLTTNADAETAPTLPGALGGRDLSSGFPRPDVPHRDARPLPSAKRRGGRGRHGGASPDRWEQLPDDVAEQVILAALARGGHPALARAVLVEGRRVAVWIRQSDGRQLRDHFGSRVDQFDQIRFLEPYGLGRDHPQVTLFDAGAETARRASGLTRYDLGPEAAEARAVRDAAGDDDPVPVVRGSFRELVHSLDGGGYGALVTVSLDRGARNDADAGLLLEVLRRNGVLVVENGQVLDVRRDTDRQQMRFKLLMAAVQGDQLIARTQQSRLQKARTEGTRVSLPSGLIYASAKDPEYARRLRAAGLEAAITDDALGTHRLVTERDGVKLYVLPFPDAAVWRTVELRVAWMRRLGNITEVLRCIRRGYGPMADTANAVSTAGMAADASPDASAEVSTEVSAEAVSGTTDGAAAADPGAGPEADDMRASSRVEDAGAASTELRQGADLIDPWADDRWPAGQAGKIPMIRHNIWRHQTRVRWARATVQNLTHWFAAPALYGEYAYTAHGLGAAAGLDVPTPVERRPGAFPAPATGADRVAFTAATEQRVGSAARAVGGSAYAGARTHAIAHAYCAHPHDRREGTIRQSGPRAGLPANRSTRAPQGIHTCGLHLTPWYGGDGLRNYASIHCSAEREHSSGVTVVVEDVVIAMILSAVDAEAVRDAVAAWQAAVAVPPGELDALRAEVERTEAAHEGTMKMGAELFGAGNTESGKAAVATVNQLQRQLSALHARLAAAEHAAAADASLVREDWVRIRRLASALPDLMTEARAADRDLDAALVEARADGDEERHAALLPYEGQLRALFDALGVTVELCVQHHDAVEVNAGTMVTNWEARSTAPGGAGMPAGAAALRRATASPDAASESTGAAKVHRRTDAIDAALVAAAAGGPSPTDGSVRVVVRFASGARHVRYADLEYRSSLQPERAWAYARLAAVPVRDRAQAGIHVAAELSIGGQLIHRRKPRQVKTWTPAQVSAAAIQFAVREFDHADDGDAPTASDAAAASLAVETPQWRSIATLSVTLAIPAADVRQALLANLLGRARWTTQGGGASTQIPTQEPTAFRGEAAALASREAGTVGLGGDGDDTESAAVPVDYTAIDCIGGCHGPCGPRCPARCIVVAPTEAQLHAAFPAYAGRCVAAREGWPADDTVALMDLVTELGVTKSIARYGAEHGAGLVKDASGRLFTRRSGYAAGPRVMLERALATQPELAKLESEHWRLQADALGSLPGVKWITLRRYAHAVTVPGAGGRKTRVWVHLPPELETRLRRTALADVIADWNRQHATATGATHIEGDATPTGPLTAELSLPRATILQSLQERGIGIAYRTYVRAVSQGGVQEVTAAPIEGGPTCAHAIVPRAVQTTRDRAVVDAWLAGRYADPSTWT